MVAATLNKALLAGAALAGLGLGAPSLGNVQGRGYEDRPRRYTVGQIANENFRRVGPMEMAKAHAKYNAPIPQSLRNAVARRTNQTGSVAANPQAYDSEYLVPVSIGSPPQTVMLDFDTGSADLWVTSEFEAFYSDQTPYDPGSSSTARLIFDYWSISYGDGSSAGGIVFTDVVDVGGVVAKHQAVELALVETASFFDNPSESGLLGLAFSTINQVRPHQQKTFFDNVKDSLEGKGSLPKIFEAVIMAAYRALLAVDR
ncbi:aspartic peptidase domain-containing protein [Diplogelasinospora grovesii]|uniref:Aspartic peptidase domain-containing protein n=1 Tax=Diplogelasinospora grovesii TaxID=303347 RepID=A0AAN6NE15_9PEZI|nr:aspartic peptidase domain-containing protein [Diplogelasinospora grovesii]